MATSLEDQRFCVSSVRCFSCFNLCLSAGHSVLVAAHTSAGKTVVAEYAFAMALRYHIRLNSLNILGHA